ncbi:MAG: hypothetical protein HS105_02345 [Chloracidobacterium sp.]|nr:hypothetical protein [Chloracidobacterium sp.]MCO5333818.1 hypothetical protein [Pyrinomonadaceae bacterium]
MRIFIVAVIIALGLAGNVMAQKTETLTVKNGCQKKAKTSKLKIKLVEVMEDSRCPDGANCIWEGNAKVKVKIVGAKETKTFEFNTNLGARGDTIDGWAVTMVSLSPVPKSGETIDPKNYTAKFEIVRLIR